MPSQYCLLEGEKTFSVFKLEIFGVSYTSLLRPIGEYSGLDDGLGVKSMWQAARRSLTFLPVPRVTFQDTNSQSKIQSKTMIIFPALFVTQEMT